MMTEMPCTSRSPAPFLEKCQFNNLIFIISFIFGLHHPSSEFLSYWLLRDFQVTECYFVQKYGVKSRGGKVVCCLICILFLLSTFQRLALVAVVQNVWLMHILTVFHNSFLHIYLSATVLVKRNNSHFVMNEKTKHPLILLFPKTLLFDPS